MNNLSKIIHSILFLITLSIIAYTGNLKAEFGSLNKVIDSATEIELKPTNYVELDGYFNVLTQQEIRFNDLSGGEYAALKAPATIASSFTLTLPDTDGAANEILETDGAGVLSWITAPISFLFTASTDNALIKADTIGANEIQESGILIDDSDNVTNLNSLEIQGSGYIDMAEIASPATPASSFGRVYIDSTTKKLATKDDAGTVTDYGEGGGGLVAAPNALYKLGLASSVAANALTIDLKQADGSSDPTSEDPVSIGYRNATLTSGQVSLVSSTAATSITVTSGATLGQVDNVLNIVYVYAINNAGATELAVSNRLLTNEGELISTTAISAAADDGATIYSTTSRSNVAFRLIGKVESTQATAGTWATTPSKVYAGNFDFEDRFANFTTTAGQSIPDNVFTYLDYPSLSDNRNTVKVTAGAGYNSTLGTWSTNPQWEILVTGTYEVTACAYWESGGTGIRIVRAIIGGTARSFARGDNNTNEFMQCTFTRALALKSGTVIQIDVYQSQGVNEAILTDAEVSYLNIKRVGNY